MNASNEPKADAPAKRPLMILFITTPAGFICSAAAGCVGGGRQENRRRVTQIEWSLYLLLEKKKEKKKRLKTDDAVQIVDVAE